MDDINLLNFFLSDFINPKKRVFTGYLMLSILLAFFWLLLIKRQTLKSTIRNIFDKKILWSGSAKADYKLFLINRVFTFFISPLLISQVAISTALYLFLHSVDSFNQNLFSNTPLSIIVALFTVSLFIVDDFTKYIVHRWMHKIPVLWAIHKVHHSAKTMTPITVYRVHPLEGVLFSLRSVFAQGAVIPTFLFFFGGAVDLYTIVGVNVLVFFFHATGSNLRHSHIDISYWKWLEHILISPSQHQVHHSIAEEHYDKNFGAALAVWDWIFGSLHLSGNKGHVVFGLDTYESGKEGKIQDLYLEPLFEIARIIKTFYTKIAFRIFNRLSLIKDLFLVQIKKNKS
jgi:sterol desaturase/sphingolipid hydroxylase (fatty acid hydroxylase superfamily)